MGADAMNLSEMGTGERVKKGADLKIHRMSRSATMTESGQRAHRLRLFSGDGVQCLLESTHMFRLIIANPGGLNGVFTRFTAVVPHPGQHLRVPLSAYNGAN